MSDSLCSVFKNLIVFDLETTGLNSVQDQIIEFGAVRSNLADGYMAVEECDLMIHLPKGMSIPTQITELTGISTERLDRDGMSADTACRHIFDMLNAGNALLAAYNAQFDLCFLYRFLKQYEKEGVLRQMNFLDAMTVFKDRRSYPHRLRDAVAAYRLQTENTHRAIDDAKATLELIQKMSEEEDDLCRYVNLFGFNPKYGIFGKKISSVTYRKQEYNMNRKLYDI